MQQLSEDDKKLIAVMLSEIALPAVDANNLRNAFRRRTRVSEENIIFIQRSIIFKSGRQCPLPRLPPEASGDLTDEQKEFVNLAVNWIDSGEFTSYLQITNPKLRPTGKSATGSDPSGEKCPLCKSSSGKPKQIFNSNREARNQATAVEIEHGTIQVPYKCPEDFGWHLRTILNSSATHNEA